MNADLQRPTTAALHRLAVLSGGIFALLGAFSGYQQRAFDSYVHMFFADHYRHHWFNTWEPRWYEGFSVTSYPPLAHQIMALLSWPLGYETASIVCTAIAMFLLPLAIASAARVFVDERSATIAAIVGSLWPTAHRVAYVYGQLPTVAAAVFVLFGMRALDRFLEEGTVPSLLLFVFFTAATTSTHHFSTVFLFGGCVAVGAKHVLFPRRARFRVLVLVGIAGLLAGISMFGTILPFWRLAMGDPQAEIPHFSRDPILGRPHTLEWIEELLLVPFSLLLAIAVVKTSWPQVLRKAGPLLTLVAWIVLYSVLAYGPVSTPLPRVLFKTQWHWLTYDRFHCWAALLFPILAGATLYRLQLDSWRALTVLFALLAPTTVLTVSHQAADKLQPPFIADIRPLLQILSGDQARHYRHLTLGFGDQFCRLDIASDSPNADGDYHTARRDPVLRKSGIGTLDASKYLARGPETLRAFLAHADEKSLRWVFVFDEWYFPFLMEAGFDVARVWDNGVTLFEKSTVPPLVTIARPQRDIWDLAWGIVPLSSLALSLGFAGWQYRTRRRRTKPDLNLDGR